MTHQRRMERFVSELTDVQSRLYAYILTLAPEVNRAHEILQNTNMAIWRKADDFTMGTNFGAWAVRIAYFEVLADRKRRSLDRHVFDDALLGELAVQAAATTGAGDGMIRALRDCMEKLPANHRELICQRYGPNGSVQHIAGQLGKSAAAISQTLYRIRRALGDCIENALAGESAS